MKINKSYAYRKLPFMMSVLMSCPFRPRLLRELCTVCRPIKILVYPIWVTSRKFFVRALVLLEKKYNYQVPL